MAIVQVMGQLTRQTRTHQKSFVWWAATSFGCSREQQQEVGNFSPVMCHGHGKGYESTHMTDQNSPAMHLIEPKIL
jgi:hypothetical protein